MRNVGYDDGAVYDDGTLRNGDRGLGIGVREEHIG